MLEEHFWNLFAKKLTGEATARELRELEQLMRTYPELGYAAESIEDVWALEQQPDVEQAHEAFEAHMGRLHTLQLTSGWDDEQPVTPLEPPHRKRRTLVLVAALLVCLAGAAWWFTRSAASAPRQLQDLAQVRQVQTMPGTKTRIVLPDSSLVWLNSGSRIVYNEAFGRSNRNLTLTGEAFFDVRKSTMPFIIKTADIQIKVLGTAFNVRSYPSERKTETSLIHGRVEITWDKRPDERIILKPNEKLTVLSDNPDTAAATTASRSTEPLIELKKLRPRPDSTITETLWMQNKLVFDSETFGQLAQRMESWYGVKIVFTESSLRELRFTGMFRNETIGQALEALRYSSPFTYTISDSLVKISLK